MHKESLPVINEKGVCLHYGVTHEDFVIASICIGILVSASHGAAVSFAVSAACLSTIMRSSLIFVACWVVSVNKLSC